jgi:hypothetical protein
MDAVSRPSSGRIETPPQGASTPLRGLTTFPHYRKGADGDYLTKPEGSVCRTTCLDTACEEGCVDTETHVRVPVDYCNIEEFLNNTADVEQAIFGGATMITRAVEVDWLSDRVEWRFA